MADKELYKKLREKYIDEELAESFVFPHGLAEEEKKKADKELWGYRKRLLETKTKEERIYSGLLKVKYQMTFYLESQVYDEEKSVSRYLQEYMKVTGRKQKELAEDLNIHPTRLSRIVNGREKLSLPVAYRLEKHSGELIPAILWWKLLQREIEQEIKADDKEKQKEKMQVKNVAYRA